MQSLAVEYTLGAEIHHNPYHVPVVRSQLTRNIGNIFSEVQDELSAAFTDVIGAEIGQGTFPHVWLA